MNLDRIQTPGSRFKARGTNVNKLDAIRAPLLAVMSYLPTAYLAEAVEVDDYFCFTLHIVHSTVNNMNSKEKTPSSGRNLRKLSLSIGHFIRYWGFRRVHGAIWTQLYLAKTPLSCTDLTHNLGLSKALISPALDELCKYKLIREAPAPNQKTKVYVAAEDVNEVIQHVLKTREAKMLQQITKDFSSFQQREAAAENISDARVKSLETMIISANMMLQIMLAQNNLMKLPMELDS
jgi:DNA-binding transcriptional regulator GbsR (MarR family)